MKVTPPPRTLAAVGWIVGQKIAERWEIQRILGGGFGTVYVVYDPELKQLFAAKTVHAELLDEDVHRRFQQEAHTWLQIGRHPHVVGASFVNVVEGRPLLFLEYVGGGDLGEWIDTPRLLEDRLWCLQLALDFCDGMEHAYRHGVRAHRDVKPQNCLLTDEGRLKISDFGLIRVLDENPMALRLQQERWEATTGLGTLTHMAPEQFSDAHNADARADVYAFGITLYQMLTGRLPFPGRNQFSLMYAHAHTPPPDLELAPLPHGVDRDLEVLVKACLAKSPADRPASFSALRPVLVDFYTRLAGARPPAPLEERAQEAFDLSCQGISLVQLDWPEAGLELLERAVQGEPRLQAAWINRAVALTRLGRLQEALTSLDVALRLGSSGPAWHVKANTLSLLGRRNEAYEAYSHSLKLEPRNVKTWIDQGLFLGGAGALQEAVDSLNQALRLNPRHPTAWTALGMTFVNADQPAEAIHCLATSVRLQPRQPVVWAYLGDVHLDLGQSTEARSCFEQALATDPRHAPAWLGLARVEVRSEDPEAALPALQRALELDASLQLAWFVLGTTLFGLSRWESAAEALHVALRLDPMDAAAWNYLGAVETHRERFDEARESFRRAADLGMEEAMINYRALSAR